MRIFDDVISTWRDSWIVAFAAAAGFGLAWAVRGEEAGLAALFPLGTVSGLGVWYCWRRRREPLPSDEVSAPSDESFLLVWTSGSDGACRYFSRAWLSLAGSTFVGKLGWAEGVHKDDVEGCLATYRAAFASREPFEMEYRLRGVAGDFRWVLDQGRPRYRRGRFVGYLGWSMDISKRRQAEEARRASEQRLRESSERLKILSAQLLHAQECERRRVTRELHDVVGQDFTAFVLMLQSVQRSAGHAVPARALAEGVGIVDRMLQRLRELCVDLRPSMLDDLGLVAALRWYLDRQASRAGFDGRFVTNVASASIPSELETTFFRVAQEALTNAARHAGPQRVDVELRQTADDFLLIVRDDGVGFDLDTERTRSLRGGKLGLLGMEERVALVGGRLEVDSRLGGGTCIRVSVKLPPALKRRAPGRLAV